MAGRGDAGDHLLAERDVDRQPAGARVDERARASPRPNVTRWRRRPRTELRRVEERDEGVLGEAEVPGCPAGGRGSVADPFLSPPQAAEHGQARAAEQHRSPGRGAARGRVAWLPTLMSLPWQSTRALRLRDPCDSRVDGRRGRGARRRRLAARGAARPPRRPLRQGRLQPAGPVRLLHGARRRRAAGGLRHARRGGSPAAPSPRSTGSTRPNAARWADAFCATGASQCGFCTPGIIVRLVGLRDRRRRRREPTSARSSGRCRPTSAAAPAGGRSSTPWDAYGVPGRAGARPGCGVAVGRPSRAGRPQRVGPAVALGEGGFADDLAPRGRARRRADGRRRVGRRRDAGRGETGGRQGAGPADHRRGSTAARRAARRLGGHAADLLGRARVPGDGRVVVRARRRAGVAAGQRRRVRRQGRLRGRRRGPPAGRPTTAGRCGCCCRARTSSAGGRSVRRSPAA